MKKFNRLVAFSAIGFLASCGTTPKEPETDVLEEDAITEATFPTININAYPPNELNILADSNELAKFAWEEFFALVWKSSYGTDGLRDQPDLGWNFSTDSATSNPNNAFPDLVVWETYAHRSELRPYTPTYPAIGFNTPTHYSFNPDSVSNYPGETINEELFNALDENNEIGSCDLYAYASEYDEENMVLYQAKVNEEEYNYITQVYPIDDSLLAAGARTKTRIANATAAQRDINTCSSDSNATYICLPCGGIVIGSDTLQGSMEIKTAWRQLIPGKDDASQFFTRNVIYFVKNPAGGVYRKNGVFGLIGIHIIHKTENYPEFVFATWEHVGVRDASQDYQYRNLNASGDEIDSLTPIDSKAIPQYALNSTAQAHKQLKELNKNSIWLNYQLVGVQGHPTNVSDSSSYPSYFLANYVIESDPTLADFHGSSIGTPHDNLPNTFYNGNEVTMGGCQGCHGVAQTGNGTDFSFLLDNVGKPVVVPETLDSSIVESIKKLNSLIEK